MIQTVDQQTYEFAQLIIKNYDSDYLKKESERRFQQQQQLQEQKKMQFEKDKYSLDYSKFQYINNEDIEEQKQQEYQKMMQENPYLKAMGCNNDRRKERQLYEKSTEEKLEAAETFKQQGNKTIKDKNYEQAAFFYEQALVQFDYTFPENEKLDKQFSFLKETVNNNMAFCQLMLGKHEKALNYLYQVLQINPQNIKALFRKAQIKLKQDFYDDAKEIIEEIYKIDPENKETKQLEQELNNKIILYKQKRKQISQKMFQ